MKHTNTPWKIDGGIGKKNERYIWMEGNYFGGGAIATVHDKMEGGSEHDAAFIVTACNSHEALCAALKAAHTLLNELQEEQEGPLPMPWKEIQEIEAALRLAGESV